MVAQAVQAKPKPIDAPAEPPGLRRLREIASNLSGDIGLTLHRDLPALAAEWRAFEQGADCTVFQTYAWLSTWQAHVGAPAGVRPAIVVGSDVAGNTLFIFPLAVATHGPARELAFLGSDLCDYNAPLLAPAFAARVDRARFVALWDDIVALLEADPALRFDYVRFTKMPETVAGQPNPFLWLGVSAHPSGAYSTRLTANWDDFYAAKRSSSTRRRDRTKRKRLADLGEVKLVAPASVADTLSTLDTLMTQKARSFARMGVGNLFARPGYRDFYRALASDPANAGLVHVSRLDVGAIPAAVNLGLMRRGVYYHLLASYDDGDVSRFGPGAAHLHDLMRHAIEHGCRVFDFTIGDEGYKRDWSDTEATLYDHVAAATWRGRLVTGPLQAAQRIKRAIKQTPVLWRLFSALRAFIGSVKGGRTLKGDKAD